ncbi:MAG: phospho-N-acetylmuramoyl-pentapeptide-transferase [Chloroflexota bacterium]
MGFEGMILSIALSFLLSFALGLAWAPALISVLRSYNMGKQIRLEGPQSHMVKAGTPTMGGWLMIVTSLVVGVVLVRDLAVMAPIALALLAFGLFGALDDYVNMRSRTGLGLRVRIKFLWHTAIALGISLVLYPVLGYDTVIVPGFGGLHIGWWMVPLSTLAIFAMTSGVNEIDGLDGLAGGTTGVAFIAYALLSLGAGMGGLATAAAIVAGTIGAFLWFNVHPARFFMGDTGSLALGASLAVVAIMSGWVLLLPVIGFVFVIELLSVVVQVFYFKATKGKRILKMSPLHHHLELSGWPEVQIVQRFWLIAVVTAALALSLAAF